MKSRHPLLSPLPRFWYDRGLLGLDEHPFIRSLRHLNSKIFPLVGLLLNTNLLHVLIFEILLINVMINVIQKNFLSKGAICWTRNFLRNTYH